MRNNLLLAVLVTCFIGMLGMGCAVRVGAGIPVYVGPEPVVILYDGPFFTDGGHYYYYDGGFYIFRGGRHHFHHYAPPHMRSHYDHRWHQRYPHRRPPYHIPPHRR